MPEDHLVEDGECISSIAYARGFFWETLWNHGSNSSLKQKRKDPNILKAGDTVHVPDLTLKEESCATEQKHKFKLKGVPAKLKLKLMRPKPEKAEEEDSGGGGGGGGGGGLLGGGMPSLPGTGGGGGGGENTHDLADPEYKPPKEEEEAIANADYVFEVDGIEVDKGKTDGDGCVKIPIIPNAHQGRLIINQGKEDERIIPMDLGGMDPVDEPEGVRKRLMNLGYMCKPDGPADADDLQAALSKFQEKNSLQVTGKIDDATKSKLKDLHGC